VVLQTPEKRQKFIQENSEKSAWESWMWHEDICVVHIDCPDCPSVWGLFSKLGL
jgi:hypothetical protein